MQVWPVEGVCGMMSKSGMNGLPSLAATALQVWYAAALVCGSLR
jgi:hypothetical protein